MPNSKWFFTHPRFTGLREAIRKYMRGNYFACSTLSMQRADWVRHNEALQDRYQNSRIAYRKLHPTRTTEITP